jgi:hypothetical protein
MSVCQSAFRYIDTFLKKKCLLLTTWMSNFQAVSHLLAFPQRYVAKAFRRVFLMHGRSPQVLWCTVLTVIAITSTRLLSKPIVPATYNWRIKEGNGLFWFSHGNLLAVCHVSACTAAMSARVRRPCQRVYGGDSSNNAVETKFGC